MALWYTSSMSKSSLTEKQDISRVMAEMGRKGGRIGGKRRAERLTPQQRREAASAAARARWGKETEAQFQQTVIELAELHRWRIYHVANVKGKLRSETSKGFPDLVLARPGRLVFAELKREGEDPTDEQEIWHALLRSAGEEMYVWRPSDWREIEEVLR